MPSAASRASKSWFASRSRAELGSRSSAAGRTSGSGSPGSRARPRPRGRPLWPSTTARRSAPSAGAGSARQLGRQTAAQRSCNHRPRLKGRCYVKGFVLRCIPLAPQHRQPLSQCSQVSSSSATHVSVPPRPRASSRPTPPRSTSSTCDPTRRSSPGPPETSPKQSGCGLSSPLLVKARWSPLRPQARVGLDQLRNALQMGSHREPRQRSRAQTSAGSSSATHSVWLVIENTQSITSVNAILCGRLRSGGETGL